MPAHASEFNSLTPADIRATIDRLHAQLEALPGTDAQDAGFCAVGEARLELRHQIAERTQAYHIAVRDLRRRIARRETP